MNAHWLPPILVLAVLVLAACVGSRPQDRQAAIGRNSLVEQARDGSHVLPRGEVSQVDPRSDLVLRFGEEVQALTVELQRAYTTAQELAVKQKQVLAKFANLRAGDEPAKAAAQSASAEYNRSATRLVGDILAMGVTREELLAGGGGYDNLLRFLEQKLAAEEAALKVRRDQATWMVTVRASFTAESGEPRFLHVPWYDELPVGTMKSRYDGFLGLDRTEAAGLAGELKQAEAAARVLRQIRAELAEGHAVLETLKKELQAELEAFVDLLKQKPKELAAALIAELDAAAAAAGTDQPTKEAAAAAKVILTGWVATFTDLQGRLQKLDQLADSLRKPATISLSDLFDRGGELHKALAELPAAMQQAGAFPRQARELATHMEKVAVAAAGAVASRQLQDLARLLGERAPVLTTTVMRVVELVSTDDASKMTNDVLATASRPAPAASETLYSPLDAAPEARVSLRGHDITEDSRIRIEAIAYPKDGLPSEARPAGTGRIIESWEADVQRFGVYPRITGELIFARADTGTAEAKSWQPNVAAVADLHVRWRDPTWLGSVWNTIDPALGVHIASLDQGDESIEFGMGVNVSMFGGFVTAGCGQNLTLDDDRTYYFLGIDLLSVLNDAQALANR